eukprot:764803-Hanusia_phi.AAC.1
MDMGSDNKGSYAPAPQADELDPEKRRKPTKRAEYLQPAFAIIAIILVAAAISFAVVYNPFSGWNPDLAMDERNMNIAKSPSDSRLYNFFILPNGLKVLTVSDSTADRAAASMDVSVGSFSDPEAFPGLAHFLEHMLFMGSKKYPDENQYSSFLAQHGGSSNAYTAAENTNYHFDIVPEHFEQALDIFAQFFISPLLREDSTEREVLAVENEHVKNLQSDGWRAQQLRKSLSNPKHPNYKFGTGNFNTLCNSTKTGTAKTKWVQSLFPSHLSTLSSSVSSLPPSLPPSLLPPSPSPFLSILSLPLYPPCCLLLISSCSLPSGATRLAKLSVASTSSTTPPAA